jgi:hypothetical protein
MIETAQAATGAAAAAENGADAGVTAPAGTETAGLGGAETERVSMGKFKTAQELVKAYGSLEAEFTKRCQRLKELERQIALAAPDDGATKETQPSELLKDSRFVDAVLADGAIREKIISDYLKDLRTVNLPRVIGKEGDFAVLPPERPRTLKQAAELAEKLFR